MSLSGLQPLKFLTLKKARELGIAIRNVCVGLPELITKSADDVSESKKTFVDVNTLGGIKDRVNALSQEHNLDRF